MKPVAIFFAFYFLLSVNTKIYAQNSNCPPPNIGFEAGTFNNWQCYSGTVDTLGNVNVSLTTPTYNRQTIISKTTAPKLDPYGNFPVLCPNGSAYSVKLGSDVAQKEAERISYTYTIPAGVNQYNLIFNYAVVLQNPNHQLFQQPRFTVKTYDVTDNTYIDCASFDFVASGNLPGFKLDSLASIEQAIYYKDWSAATINLQGYGGKTIRLEFTVNGCTLGAHFGYAYLDVIESCTSPIGGNAYCNGQNFVNLVAPQGFETYTWYQANNLSAPIGHSQTLNLTPAPADQTQYAVILQPLNGLGCVDTLYTVVSKIDSSFTFKVQDTIYACINSSIDLTTAAVTTGSDANLIYSYYSDQAGLQYLHTPDDITQSGTYYIEAVSPSGCTNILPVTVVFIDDNALKVTNPPPVIYPATVNITTAFTPNSSFTYAYYSNSAATDVVNGADISKSGTYYIKAQSVYADCSVVKPVTVVINPPPPPSVTAVNTFTPNNDGINDHFLVTLMGFIDFGSLKIYNRNGQLIFETRSLDIFWDGTVNGKPGNVGTYYWVFEGTNSYYGTKVFQAGFIALIR